MTAIILLVGGSFGGLATAFALRRKLDPAAADISVIAKSGQFTFIPSLP